MTSGIYSLTFADGIQYVGKSINIEKRWVEHGKSMQLGKASIKMMAAYKEYGLPDGQVLFEIHPDHLDIVECYLINKYRPVLNTTVSNSICENEFDEIMSDPNLLKWSTLDHIREILASITRIEKLESEVENLLEEYDIPEYHKLALSVAEQRANKAERKLKAYLTLPWYSRIFL